MALGGDDEGRPVTLPSLVGVQSAAPAGLDARLLGELVFAVQLDGSTRRPGRCLKFDLEDLVADRELAGAVLARTKVLAGRVRCAPEARPTGPITSGTTASVKPNQNRPGWVANNDEP